MTPQELKSSILQLAIQGKLVEQRPEEGAGEELYQAILLKRQLLVKAGKFKKEKSLPENNAPEVPFDIPVNWKWVLLEEIAKNQLNGVNLQPILPGVIHWFLRRSVIQKKEV